MNQVRKSSPASIVIAAALVVIAVLLLVLFFILPGGNGKAADTEEESTSADITEDVTPGPTDEKAETEEETVETRKVHEQDFEAFHQSLGEILEQQEIVAFLDKWGIPHEVNQNREIIVQVDRSFGSLLMSNDDKRCKSAKRAGLSDFAISDAPEEVFDTINNKVDVKKILTAESKGIGTLVDFSEKKLKELRKEDVATSITNVVIGLSRVEADKDRHYGESKTVYELSQAHRFIIDETEKAWDAGDGWNRWLETGGDGHLYVCQDWLKSIIPVINQRITGCELEARVVNAENYGLRRSDYAILRRCYLSTEMDKLAALVYVHHFKDGSIMERPATNLRDRRSENPIKVVAAAKVRPAATSRPPRVTTKPGGTPNPTETDKPDPRITSDPKGTTSPAPTATPGFTWTPTPTIAPTATPWWTYIPNTPVPTPIGTKAPGGVPTGRPNDNQGHGPEEVSPPPRPSSDTVPGAQHQPSAAPQGGGTSTPREDLNQPTVTTAPGGQLVTDPHGDGERTENDQASTDPIGENGRAPARPDDSQNGNNGGGMSAPD